MSVTIAIPRALRQECDGRHELPVAAATVRAALERLEQHHSSLYRCICDETGSLRQHVNLFVNDCYLYEREGLDTQLSPGDTLTIMPAVSGG